MKIAIKFGDNDFWSTFHGVLNVINEAYIYKLGSHDEIDVTDKERLCKMINELSFGCYITRQNGNRGYDENEHTREYLKITTEKIYVNEEVTQLIIDYTGGNGNGDISILDTDLNFNNNNPIYSI